MIDVKKLLYKSKQLAEARRNALTAIDSLEERDRRYRRDDNWYIRGTTMSDPVANVITQEEDTLGRIEYMRWVVRELNTIIDAISRAAQTLNDEQRNLITLRYFNDNTVTYVCGEMHIKENKYNYTHKIALEAMGTCLNPLCITEEFLDSLLFSGYKVKFDALSKPRKIQDFERIMSGFQAS